MSIDDYKKYEPVDGKWYFKREIGGGAYGTVFEMERKDIPDLSAALKIVTIPQTQKEVKSFRQENYSLDDESVCSYYYSFVEEFQSEVKLMLRLSGNSNIVSYMNDEVIKHDDGVGWDILILMEMLTPINQYFAEHMPDEATVVKLGIDICRALEVCERYHIVHRDIKPANIFISEIGNFKLGDFGVARTLEKTASELSKKGTANYMAPEVYKGEKYDLSVDIYSLGIVMYRLLNNNKEPFRTELTYKNAEDALFRRISGEALPSPANASDELSKIILKACAYDAKDRYKTSTEMKKALEAINTIDTQIKTEENDFNRGDIAEETVGLFEAGTKTDLHNEETVGFFDTKDATEDNMQNKTIKPSNKSVTKKINRISIICATALIILCAIMPMGYKYPHAIGIRYFVSVHEQTNANYFVLLIACISRQPITSVMSILNLICSGAMLGCFVFERIKKKKVNNLILNILIICQIVFVLIYAIAMSVHFAGWNMDEVIRNDIIVYGLEVLLFISLNIVIFKINKVNKASKKRVEGKKDEKHGI